MPKGGKAGEEARAAKKAVPKRTRGQEGGADEEEGGDWEDSVRQQERADQDRCKDGGGQEW